MKARFTSILIAGALLVVAASALAEPVRQNAIWARSTNGAALTLDGVLNEAAWAAAESKEVRLGRGYDNGVPGSGYVLESGIFPKDSTRALFKFLTAGNQLWMGVVVQDSSVGGSGEFNRMDGLLMAIKDHLSLGHPAPAAEYLYSWWNEDPGTPDPKAPGLSPVFGGRWATPPWGSPRTPEQEAAWNAVTVVNGQSNNDAVIDNGYTIEMRFDLTVMGYDIEQPGGDIIEWNVAIYDCDWFWPELPRYSGNRTWWQSPWGNTAWYDEVRIYAAPSVHVASGPVPVVGPEVRIPNGAAQPTPTIDGLLSESVWGLAPGIRIKYGDDAVRATYGNPLKWRAGQYQPPVGDGPGDNPPDVINPGDAMIKWFFKGNFLYLGFDVMDESVTSIPEVDRWDGFIVSINDKVARWRDQNLESRRLAFRVGETGQAVKEDWTDSLITVLGGGQLAMALKANTTVDTTGLDFDEGYTAEFKIDLTKLGYPVNLGDGALWIGINFLDGDCYTPYTNSYGTRTWYGREWQHQCCPASAYLDPNLPVASVWDDPGGGDARFALLGNFPNPFEETTTVRFTMAVPSRVTVEVFDLQGRLVSSRPLGLLQAGSRSTTLDTRGLQTGIYVYRLLMEDPGSGALQAELSGKLMLMK